MEQKHIKHASRVSVKKADFASYKDSPQKGNEILSDMQPMQMKKENVFSDKRNMSEDIKETIGKNLQETSSQPQEMEEIRQLVGRAVHGFNNILGVIRGTADMALERVKSGTFDPIKLEKSLESIMSAVDRGAVFSSQLMDFARKGKRSLSETEPK